LSFVRIARLASVRAVFVVGVALSLIASGQPQLTDLPGGDGDDIQLTIDREMPRGFDPAAVFAVPERRSLRGEPWSPPLLAGRHAPVDLFRPPIEAATV
jgi:hypothetical protein